MLNIISFPRRIRILIHRSLERYIDAVASKVQEKILNITVLRRLDVLFWSYFEKKALDSGNPLLKYGRKYYSQNDEDGILLEVLRRLNLSTGTFIEIGVGDGCENNTIILLMSGWAGAWIGAEDLSFPVSNSSKLSFRRCLVNTSTVVEEVGLGLCELNLASKTVDLLSIDIDSYDYHICEQLLKSGLEAKVVIVEYNGKFPPPIRFVYPVDEPWDGTDFSGCSLQSWVDLLSRFNYSLICCNVTGVNAFFVKNEYLEAFGDVPKKVDDIFMPANYNWFVQCGHPVSARTISSFL